MKTSGRYNLLIFADWVNWAKKNGVPYFGTEIDPKQGDIFKELSLNMQPTEELIDSPGVTSFVKAVSSYFDEQRKNVSFQIAIQCR